MQTRKVKKVAIVGAGIGGLSLAYLLLKKGYKVDIYERSDKAGGLAGGFPLLGTSSEMAYHHIFTSDKFIIDLVYELGLEDKLHWNKSSVAVWDGKIMQKFVGAGDLLKFKGLGLLDKIRLGGCALWLGKDRGWEKYIKIPAYKFMHLVCGEKVYKKIWEPLLVGKFHKFYKSVSMAWLWARINIRANSKSKDGEERLGYFEGGFVIIVDELLKNIKKMGGRVIYNTATEEIESGYIKVGGKKKSYDKIVFTGPNGAFANLISESKHIEPVYLYKLRKTNFLGAICMVFTSKQSLSPYYWHNMNDNSLPFLCFIQHTNFVPKEWYKNRHVYYLGVYVPHEDERMSAQEEELYNSWFEKLKGVYPDFKLEQIEEKFLFRFKNAQHVVTCDYPEIKPNYTTPLKNVYLMNFAQLFPEDRGVNFSVREALKLVEII